MEIRSIKLRLMRLAKKFSRKNIIKTVGISKIRKIKNVKDATKAYFKINDELDMYLYKKTRIQKKRAYIFNYLAQGLKNGQSVRALLESINIGLKSKDPNMNRILSTVLDLMEVEGYSDMEAMYKAGLITKIEFNAINNMSKSEPYKSYEFIINRTKNEANLKWGVVMLILPIVMVLVGFIIFQPELKAFTEELLSPVNNISTKQIEVPEYFESRSLFIYLLLGVFGLVGIFAYIINHLKENNVRLLFKVFRIYEREFIINNLAVFLSLLRAGAAPIEAIKVLSEDGNEKVTKKIFKEIEENQEQGLLKINEVFSKYDIDEATVAYVRSGEDNNDLERSLTIVLEYNQEKYEKLIKVLSRVLPMIGEFAMAIALLKPLIDIINVTTIGTMGFEI